MRAVGLRLVLAALVLVAGACGGAGTGDTTTTVSPSALAEGQRLFEGTCSVCHGSDAQGLEGLGKSLVQNEFIAAQSDAEMIQFLEIGRAADHPDNTTGVAMPPKGGNPSLTEQDLSDIIVYLRSLGASPGE